MHFTLSIWNFLNKTFRWNSGYDRSSLIYLVVKGHQKGSSFGWDYKTRCPALEVKGELKVSMVCLWRQYDYDVLTCGCCWHWCRSWGRDLHCKIYKKYVDYINVNCMNHLFGSFVGFLLYEKVFQVNEYMSCCLKCLFREYHDRTISLCQQSIEIIKFQINGFPVISSEGER